MVGGRWLRQVRKVSRSRRSRRNVTSPLPRTSRRSSSRALDADLRTHELRRSSRLVSTLPRSDYSISERWSYGTDVYETRYDTTDADNARTPTTHKRGRTSSHDKKKRKSHTASNSKPTDECVAYCTRSRTALKSCESVSEHKPNALKPNALPRPSSSHNADATNQQQHPNHAEGGLLPLDERDFAYSPFSSSTITELLDSDYSVYSPTANRRKGKKRKRSTHRSLSHKKSNFSIDLDDYRKKFKIDLVKESSETSRDNISEACVPEYEAERSVAPSSQAICTYRLRNRHNRDLGAPTSTVISDTGNYGHI